MCAGVFGTWTTVFSRPHGGRRAILESPLRRGIDVPLRRGAVVGLGYAAERSMPVPYVGGGCVTIFSALMEGGGTSRAPSPTVINRGS